MFPVSAECATLPVGVFDSGLGGLTIARELLHQHPHERVMYVGDSAHMPYGERTRQEIQAFTLSIGQFLLSHQCRALVVACNTATSLAIEHLRAHVSVPVVGTEPGVKPGVEATKTGRVGVLATPGTTRSSRTESLIERFAGGVTVETQSCPGLADRVEAGDFDGPQTRALLESFVLPLLERGADTLVLGCTHYPVLIPLLRQIAGPNVTIIDTGQAVARQLARVAPLPNSPMLSSAPERGSMSEPRLIGFTTGDIQTFARRARTILAAGNVPQAASVWHGLCWREGKLHPTNPIQ